MKTDLHSFDFPEDEEELLDSTYAEKWTPWEEDEFNRKIHMLSDERYEEIKLKVVELFECANVQTIPVNVFELAGRLGLQVIPYPSISEKRRSLFLKLSEDAFFVPGKAEIYYNDRKSKGRIKMSLFHEIGHSWLKHTEPSGELVELEASFFAKFAMAPPIIVHCLGLKNAGEIMELFGHSFEAGSYAWNYYQKWAVHSTPYSELEMRLCRQFKVSPEKLSSIK